MCTSYFVAVCTKYSVRHRILLRPFVDQSLTKKGLSSDTGECIATPPIQHLVTHGWSFHLVIAHLVDMRRCCAFWPECIWLKNPHLNAWFGSPMFSKFSFTARCSILFFPISYPWLGQTEPDWYQTTSYRSCRMASIPSQAYLNEDGRSRLLIANVLAIVFSGLFFAGRMASRLMKKSHKECSFDASDYNLLAGMILAWTAFVLIIYGQSSSQTILYSASSPARYWLLARTRYYTGIGQTSRGHCNDWPWACGSDEDNASK